MAEDISFTTVADGDLLEEVGKRGYFAAKQPPQRGDTFKVDLKGKSFRFGVVSDSHFGSRYTQLTDLETCYDFFVTEKVKTVLHCGDLTDGTSRMHPGQEFELCIHGLDNMVQYCIDKYPVRRGVRTKIISGNHDWSFWKDSGVDIVKLVCSSRKDMDYLGSTLAFVDMNDINIGLMHGSGGTAYARSYRLQKIIEQLAPEMKPNILLLGHYHCSCLIPAYRNVEAVQVGCFQAQTPYLASKGLFPSVSGLVVNVTTNEGGIATINYEWLPFFKMLKDDI